MDILLKKIFRQFRLLIWIAFISQFVHTKGWGMDGVKGEDESDVFLPAASITSLEYMKIWCDIQVIIY